MPVLALLAAATLSRGVNVADFHATYLRCEYRVDPLGVDSPKPRLSWVGESAERGQAQTAYHLLASSSLARLNRGEGDLWDSGSVKSGQPFNVAYSGKALASREQVFWKVRLAGHDGRLGDWSKSASFEVGLLTPNDWGAEWINDGKPTPTRDEEFYKDDPAPLFRREFEVLKKVVRARLSIAGLGYYEASLNGERVGDHVLDPGWTAFGKRVYYSTYDVTAQIRDGSNCIGVTLGNGWYNPLPLRMFGQYNLREHLDIGRPRFIARLDLEHTDGSHESVVSNQDWTVGEGAIRFDNVYMGERVDARFRPAKWDSPGFGDTSWRRPGEAKEPIGSLEAQPQPPIRVQERIPAVKLTEPKPGVFIYDFGREFAGWASVRLNVPNGTKMVLRYGELLHDDGTLNVMTSVAGQIKGTHKNKDGQEESTGGPGAPPIVWQTDAYIARGEDGETYTPKFTFHAFRYMELTGLAKAPPLEDVTGLRLSSDVPSAGEFACSNELFNQIQQMVRRTFLANIFSVQSDCPHRERLGYGGDIVGTSEAFMLNFDMSTFYAKTVQDFADAARPDGMLTDTAPFIGIQYCGIGWAMAMPLLAAQLDSYYGNREPALKHYEAAKRWLELVDKAYPDGIVHDGLSDHESLDPGPPETMVTPLYFESVKLLSRLNKITNANDGKKWLDLEEKVGTAYRSHIFDSSTGKAGLGSQGSQSFGLWTDAVGYFYRDPAMQVLLARIHGDGMNHLSTGILGTKFMLDELSKAGHADVAYAIVNQTDFPSWGWMLANGATTMWEHWAKEESVYSHCHPMFGSVSQWFYNWLGGIQPAPGSEGFERIVIAPQFVNGLDWVQSSHETMYGRIVSNWRCEGGRIVLELEIPVGSSADVYLPAGGVSEGGRAASVTEGVHPIQAKAGLQGFRVESGHYRFEFTSAATTR